MGGDRYNENDVLQRTELGLGRGTAGVMMRGRAACVMIGAFYAESLFMAKSATPSEQFDSRYSNVAQIPFFVAAYIYAARWEILRVRLFEPRPCHNKRSIVQDWGKMFDSPSSSSVSWSRRQRRFA